MTEFIQQFNWPKVQLPFHSGTGRILITQCVTTLVVASVFTLAGVTAFYSALLGGAACLVPNAYAVWRVFGKNRSLHPCDPRIFGVMLRAEMIKIALTGVVFSAIFWAISSVNPVALFTAFTLVTFAGWIEAGLRLR